MFLTENSQKEIRKKLQNTLQVGVPSFDTPVLPHTYKQDCWWSNYYWRRQQLWVIRILTKNKFTNINENTKCSDSCCFIDWIVFVDHICSWASEGAINYKLPPRISELFSSFRLFIGVKKIHSWKIRARKTTTLCACLYRKKTHIGSIGSK